MSDSLVYLRGNKNVKVANVVENVTTDEYVERAQEIIRCRKDPIYFANKYYTIISPGEGKHIIKLFPKQEELINCLCDEDRVVVLASRQTGKTTSYTIFALWTAMFNPDKNILICANKERTALEFIQRIKLAYELMPNWLKPGIMKDGWNKRDIKFSNRSNISGLATSADSARGSACNILILDEFAFVDNGIADEFWQSVYPVISSATGTKVVIVSTPNGMGNLFYETYERAMLGIDEDGWVPFRIDWWERPGRDQAWKEKTIASYNGDMKKFNQEFGNVFHGSSFTLIPEAQLKAFKESVKNKKSFEPIIEKIGALYELKVWEQFLKGHTYIIGADTGEGIQKDYSTAMVFDITDTSNIRQVASFADNTIGQTEFSYVLAKIGHKYGKAFIAMENNGISKVTVENLWLIFEYENMINYGGKIDPTRIGIHSHNSIKVNACLWLKDLMSYNEIDFTINDKNLVYEMGWFERKVPSPKVVFQAVSGKHDDYMLAFVWAMYCLNSIIIDNYFVVEKQFHTAHHIDIPHIVKNFQSEYYSDEEPNMFNDKPEEPEKPETVNLDEVGSFGDSKVDRLYRQLKSQYENPNSINNQRGDSEFENFGFASNTIDHDDGWINL